MKKVRSKSKRNRIQKFGKQIEEGVKVLKKGQCGVLSDFALVTTVRNNQSLFYMLLKITCALSSIYSLPCNTIVHYNLNYSVTAFKDLYMSQACHTTPNRYPTGSSPGPGIVLSRQIWKVYSSTPQYSRYCFYVGFTVFLCHKMWIGLTQV